MDWPSHACSGRHEWESNVHLMRVIVALGYANSESPIDESKFVWLKNHDCCAVGEDAPSLNKSCEGARIRGRAATKSIMQVYGIKYRAFKYKILSGGYLWSL